MRARDDRLAQFFGGYFNQDCEADGARSWEDVVARYVRENRRDEVSRTIADLRSWLEQDVAAGRDLAASFGCDFDPRRDGLSHAQWVELLVALMEKQLMH